MTSTATPPLPTTRPGTSPAARRVGYGVAIAVNVILLWVAHQLLDWGWPSFLTQDFDQLLPLVTASFVTGMVVNAGFLLRDRGRFRAFGDLVNAAFGLALGVLTWDVFPFDFSGWETDWTWLIRTVLVVGIVGTSIAILVNLARFVRGTDEPAGR